MTYKNQTTFISSQEVQYLKTSQSAMQDCYDIGGFKCVIQFLVHKSTIEKNRDFPSICCISSFHNYAGIFHLVAIAHNPHHKIILCMPFSE